MRLVLIGIALMHIGAWLSIYVGRTRAGHRLRSNPRRDWRLR